MSQLVFKDFCIHWIFDHPWYAISGCFASFYTVYYLAFIVKRPILSCGDKKFRQFIDTYCPISKERFWPTWWCFESRAQTILRALIQSSPKVDYTSEHLTTSDGGEIRLDWNENDSNSKFSKHERPTILMLPGLTGSSKENYILHMVYDARNLGYRSVVFNNRGTGDTQLKTPRTYCAANTEDTEFVIKHIRTKYPNAPLIGVGVSLGGMILFNYMAKTGKSACLLAAMSISVGWDVFAACNSLDKFVNYYLFNKTLARSLCYLVKK